MGSGPTDPWTPVVAVALRTLWGGSSLHLPLAGLSLATHGELVLLGLDPVGPPGRVPAAGYTDPLQWLAIGPEVLGSFR